ncbi:MAG: hypothetical protein ACKVUS_05945 [Saprospiraceae bacterium]
MAFSVTVKFEGAAQAIHTKAGAIPAFSPAEDFQGEDAFDLKALWDTGATHSCISERLARAITHLDGNTLFSFRMPSAHSIDYEQG